MATLLPKQLLQSLKDVKGFDEESFLAVHEPGKQVVSIRLNPGKMFNAQCSISNDQMEKVKWSGQGHYLSERPSFTLDPLFHGGAYYVQEASSMFLEEIMRQTVDLTKPLKILDLCAAPGGKSTLLQSIISDKSLLVSNDVIKSRANILCENITKWGATNVVVTNNDPQHFQSLGEFFDVILVDAPCSGSGLFRKDPEAIKEWSEENVQLCSQRQQRILADILPALKEGGVLIYATCSYSVEEDESIADWLIREMNLETCRLNINDTWGIVETQSAQKQGYGYRFFPNKLKGEGLFIAAFRKMAKDNSAHEQRPARVRADKQKELIQNISSKEMEMISHWLADVQDYCFIKLNEEIIAVPAFMENDLKLLRSCLYIKKTGVKIGAIIRDELIPAHELAVSNCVSREVPHIDVALQIALAYLRREEINLDTGLSGWALIRYENLPLGWVKILPARINNYYPKNWRILNK